MTPKLGLREEATVTHLARVPRGLWSELQRASCEPSAGAGPAPTGAGRGGR